MGCSYLKLSATPPALRTLTPGLGEHPHEILASLGYSEVEIEAFRQRGVIAA
jgi:crotonobetainyl-CoA:carnitine CoA-transferase CaiB-like acyl-CoA transferase